MPLPYSQDFFNRLEHCASYLTSFSSIEQVSKNPIFQQAAGLNRKDTLLWNVILLRVVNVRTVDRKEALHYLEKLIALLLNLEVVVLSGSEAQKYYKTVRMTTEDQILETYHTGDRGLNSQGKREEFIKCIILHYREVVEIISIKINGLSL